MTRRTFKKYKSGNQIEKTGRTKNENLVFFKKFMVSWYLVKDVGYFDKKTAEISLRLTSEKHEI